MSLVAADADLPALRKVAHAARDGATGELRWRTSTLDAKVYLKRGRVAWATSSRSRFSLGRELARRSSLSPVALRDAIAAARRERLSLGEAFARANIIHLDAVREMLRTQIADALSTITDRENEAAVFVPAGTEGVDYDETLTFALDEVSAYVRALGNNPPRSAAGIEVGSMANVKETLVKVMEIDGALGCCIVDSNSGMMLGSAGGDAVNLEVAAAGNTEVVRAKRKTMAALGLNDQIDDMLITLGRQYHIIRPLSTNDALFFYLVLDKTRGNLAMARHQLTALERALTI